jgi:hypothetical protein
MAQNPLVMESARKTEAMIAAKRCALARIQPELIEEQRLLR